MVWNLDLLEKKRKQYLVLLKKDTIFTLFTHEQFFLILNFDIKFSVPPVGRS